ncbi:hypothetical protein KC331_g12169 [Hortaea werneckii]|nr:hypothetical protein KC331_g12169 [Hortaea werneckii]KAI7700461.1 hypothetical protein KC353_g15868 [Hortaea werneckii]
MSPFRGGPNGSGNMNSALRAGDGMNGRTGPPGIGGPPGMGNINGINGAPSMRGMNSTRGIPGTDVPQPGPTGPNPSTGSSGPPFWRRGGRHIPIDEATGKIDRRAVGGTAGQNGIEKDGDLFIIECMGTPGRPFNPYQRDLQAFWANPLMRPKARKAFWKSFDDSARREWELWQFAPKECREWWLRQRR